MFTFNVQEKARYDIFLQIGVAFWQLAQRARQLLD